MTSHARRWPAARLALLLAVLAPPGAACAGSSGGVLHQVGAPLPTGQGLAPVPAATAQPQTPGGQLPAGDGSNQAAAAPREDLKIVYTGSLDLLVADLDAALAKGRTAVLATGAYVGASDESRKGDMETAVITSGTAESRWEDTLAGLRGIAKQVLGEKTQAAEVGGQIVDLEARLRNLRASEQVLVGIAQGTGKVTDLLEVQQRISEVRGEIEQLDGQRAALVDQAAYGTLVTTYGLAVAQVEQAKAGWDPAADVDGASATLIGAVQALTSGAIWFGIVWLPLLLVLLLVALLARRAYRRFAPSTPGGGPMTGWGSGA